MIKESENLTKEITEDGLIFEVGYAAYLRANNYNVDDITDIDTVQSGSDPDKKYLVCKVHTYKYPKDDDRLDVTKDKIKIAVCSCWAWRTQESADLESQNPSECGNCKHCLKTFRTEKAKNDENQETL